MGFRSGAYCTIWEVKPISDTLSNGRVSISKKNKNTGEYETDFSGFVSFIGTGAASKAMKLKEKDRIKLGDVDVSTTYVKEKNVTYTNFKIFNFENVDSISGTGGSSYSDPSPTVDNGEMDDDLPF